MKLSVALLATLLPVGASAKTQDAPAQRPDLEYNRLIDQYLVDKRITTELVDHMPASDTVPSPLKFFGRIPGTPGELTYAADIQRYYAELARTSKRVRLMKIGTSEEGRDVIALAIADEDVLANLDRHKVKRAALGDPRKTTEAQARAIIRDGRPIYWITSGIHSPETGGPEMLNELAYRLAVERLEPVSDLHRRSPLAS